MIVDDFLAHMPDVSRCADSLREMNQTWSVIETTAKMNCPDEAHSLMPMLTATRRGFRQLEHDLVHSLARQNAANVMASIGTTAQHVIDIIVRNLFERTADVGFLATDQVLCDFVAGVAGDRAAVTGRLRAYRDKYTVYDEILLVGLDGRICAHIDTASAVDMSGDPLIRQTLESDTWAQTFRATDLRPGRGPCLVYSQRMLHPATQRPVGVLCLVFGFATEMAGIYASRQAKDGRSITLLLDADDRVISSADESWIAPGTRVPTNRARDPSLLTFRGCEYLVGTAASAGYQGYPGPVGWQAQVMIPAQVAFGRQRGEVLRALEPSLATGLLTHAGAFCPPLQNIVEAAETIRRVVWNGQVTTGSEGLEKHKLRTVLEQIGEAGARSDEVFNRSISELFDAALTANSVQARFAAQLVVELLDRNLYERADDCRWWAMTPALRRGLAQRQAGAAPADEISRILEGINALYTVYTRLVVYDRSGCIVAASALGRPGDRSLIGQTIDGETLNAVLALRTAQDYHVTPFRISDLYEGRPTQIYHAAIRQHDDERLVVGGIGIVFDGEAQFAAMLEAGVPAGSDSVALFVDRQGRIMSSTSALHAIGSVLPLSRDMLALDNGESRVRIERRDGQYGLVASAVSRGYREFKTTDGHRDDVVAVIIQRLGAEVVTAARRDAMSDGAAADGAAHYATFHVDAGVFALPTTHVVEALSASDVKRVSMKAGGQRVGLIARHSDGPVHSYVWVFDLNALLGGVPSTLPGRGSVVVCTHGGKEFGLLVSDLGGVPAFAPRHIFQPPVAPGAGLIHQLLRAPGTDVMIQVIDPQRLHDLVLALGGGAPLVTARAPA